ncbi:hypothetical protein [Silvibacterium acidisoli]|uniref:hypothetical protein n=1 Tax=Acidobacteriaceae bacterium ZG23-2 TaxID=2883246 RepID=UPI00406CEFF4
MRMMKAVFGFAVVLIALTAGANAQTVVFNAVGSSAQFLELGQAAGSATSGSPAGLGATCVWSNNQGSDPTHAIQVTDPTTSQTETGNSWIAWTPNSSRSCTSVDSTTQIYVFLQTDSVIGDRCFFNGCKFGTSESPSGSAPDNLIFPAGSTTPEISLTPDVWTAVNNSVQNAAATDIRPEDAAFATQRALASCDATIQTSTGADSGYRGLGYSSGGTPVESEYSSSTFHITNFTFNANSKFTVTPLGAVPVVVIVHPSDTTGFGSRSFTNITRANLSNYLDGLWGNTSHVITGSNAPTTVVVREPASGTYNTMEFAVPNTVARLVSQDVGKNQPTGQNACSGGVALNPLNLENTDGGYRNRAIGTGQEISVVENLTAPVSGNPQEPNSIGYAFWSTANFAAATTANAKYIQVDGVDPIETTYATAGVLPTTANGTLNKVTFANINNGTYPIWSLLRLVSATPAPAAVTSIATAAQGFVATTTQPDFVPFTGLTVLHSHFTPPGITYPSASTTSTPTPNNGGACGTEAGGDVGGVILASTSCTTGSRM